ncbi:hypothetical protein CDEST_14895 [Colletotrichum destructivum]|uniref:Acid phosphatase n=1 Tax=Colletotrichum destructivum TaxID=34406 RepID=A0AAX4J324_9PEZI|nr:hypothetical protein CDEST_14895 [Colletotrichum destructivum]
MPMLARYSSWARLLSRIGHLERSLSYQLHLSVATFEIQWSSQLLSFVPAQESSACQRLISGGNLSKGSQAYVKDTSFRSPGENRVNLGFLRLGGNNWTLEISAMVLSIASLAAIVVLLPLFENKPVTQWSFPLSFNAMVSILGATSRVSLGFTISACIKQGKLNWYRKRNDDVMVLTASKRPAAVLGQANWTALGAISAVLLVWFEPFLQAVIAFSGEAMDVRASSAVAGIGRIKRLDVGIHNYGYSIGSSAHPDFPQIAVQGMRSQYDFGALAAVWEGFSNLSTVQTLAAGSSCPTGNCTWDSYASLAVCSACHDVSCHITQSSGKAGLTDSAITLFLHPAMTIFVDKKTYPYTRYKIAGIDVSISNYHGIARSSIYGDKIRDDEYQTASSFMIGAELTARATCNPGQTLSFTDSKTLFISNAVLQASVKYRERLQPWEQSKITAEECALFFSYDQHTNYSLYSGPRDMVRTDLQLVIPRERYAVTTGFHEDDDQPFNISFDTVGSVGRWLLEEFSQYRPPRQNEMLAYPTYGGEPPVLQGLATSANIAKTFENVAASLTKWMRNRSLQTEPFVGTTKQWVVQVKINWALLSMLLGALLGGCVSVWCRFRRLVGWCARHGKEPRWQLSPMASTTIPGRSCGKLQVTASLGSPKNQCNFDIRFVDSDGGLELVHIKENRAALGRTG